MNSTAVPRFSDRGDAGHRLAERVAGLEGAPDALVLGLPRGGVPVAYEVAMKLGAELDVFVVRKLGVPGMPELAMGALCAGGARVMSRGLVERMGISHETVEEVVARESAIIARQERHYRPGGGEPVVRGRSVVVVDDGIATGSTMRAAILGLRRAGARRIVAAVPAGAREAVDDLRAEADAVACLVCPEPFYAVGQWYEDFAPTSDDEVRGWLEAAARRQQTWVHTSGERGILS